MVLPLEGLAYEWIGFIDREQSQNGCYQSKIEQYWNVNQLVCLREENLRIFEMATGKMLAQFLLNVAIEFAVTISTENRFHIEATRAVNQSLRWWYANRGRATLNVSLRNPGIGDRWSRSAWRQRTFNWGLWGSMQSFAWPAFVSVPGSWRQVQGLQILRKWTEISG